MRQLSEACLDAWISTGELAARAAVLAADTIAELRCSTGEVPRCGTGITAVAVAGEVPIIVPPGMRASHVTRAGFYSGTGRVAVTP
jgi:hypothetical protein